MKPRKLQYAWHGSASAQDQRDVEKQVAKVLGSGDYLSCSCSVLKVAVYGDRLNSTLTVMIKCPCSAQGIQFLFTAPPKPD